MLMLLSLLMFVIIVIVIIVVVVINFVIVFSIFSIFYKLWRGKTSFLWPSLSASSWLMFLTKFHFNDRIPLADVL